MTAGGIADALELFRFYAPPCECCGRTTYDPADGLDENGLCILCQDDDDPTDELDAEADECPDCGRPVERWGCVFCNPADL